VDQSDRQSGLYCTSRYERISISVHHPGFTKWLDKGQKAHVDKEEKRKKEKKKKMEKKRKRKESKWEKKTKERKGKEEGKEVLIKPWHTFLAVSFKVIPLIMLLGKKRTQQGTNRGKKIERKQAKGSVLNEGAFKCFSRFVKSLPMTFNYSSCFWV
jgi:transcription initiation factor TFIID subunit TAF12